MNLVFFVDAIKHICRVSRVLKQARGNCLLVGISGSGRQSLSRLATVILEFTLKTIVITKNFKMEDFNMTVIDLMRTTGAEQIQTTFLVNESDIKFEAQVESINNLLNTGEVPNLFESTQLNMKAKEDIMQTVRERCNKDGYSGNQEG
jgi:dynein heavy chain